MAKRSLLIPGDTATYVNLEVTTSDDYSTVTIALAGKTLAEITSDGKTVKVSSKNLALPEQPAE